MTKQSGKTLIRRKRSEKLTETEKNQFVKYVQSFDTKVDCAEALQITRVTLDLVIVRGSGRFDTIAAIREAIKNFK